MTTCPLCSIHYGDDHPCDEGKPVNSPHRARMYNHGAYAKGCWRIEILRRLESARSGLADARELINSQYPIPTEATRHKPAIVWELAAMVERVTGMIKNLPK